MPGTKLKFYSFLGLAFWMLSVFISLNVSYRYGRLHKAYLDLKILDSFRTEENSDWSGESENFAQLFLLYNALNIEEEKKSRLGRILTRHVENRDDIKPYLIPSNYPENYLKVHNTEHNKFPDK